tara:strand:+ start:173 stop:526 length:354 start_codon:yes stop_codon:yes gene_type:complete
MLFSETKYDGVYPIQAYGKNFFRIRGEKINGGIFLYSEILMSWHGNEDLSFLKENISSMEILFIGVKEYDPQFQKNLSKSLNKFGTFVEFFSIPVACRAYNVSISGHRKAGVLLEAI